MLAPGIHFAAQLQPPDPTLPREQTGSSNWRVIHACEHVRDVLSVAEGQVAVGMRPYIVTPQGSGAAELYLSGKEPGQPAPLSLLRSWQDVRKWRKSILECDPANSADVVHAHSFAAGMAAVRGCDGVVYDFRDCIDELAIATGQVEPGSWMGRSFRAAEQFILSRASAVIVHSLGMKQGAQERGAPPANVFFIPDPLGVEDAAADVIGGLPAPASEFRFGLQATRPKATVFFAPQLGAARNEKLPPSAMLLLDALVVATRELADCVLLLEAAEGTRASLEQQLNQLGLAQNVAFVDAANAAAAWQSAQVVIALGESNADPATLRQSNPVCLRALRQGATLLAADIPRNRDASPEGRGCLWFEPNNARDLGCRMAFLSGNPDFRAALAATGRAHLVETRGHAVIGKKYAEAYRHAASRKKTKSSGPELTVFYPAVNSV